MKKSQRSCILDMDRNTLTCNETGGTKKQYDISGSLVSAESKKIKDENVGDLVSAWKQCNDTGKCAAPVSLRVFKIDSCPSCRAHAQSMKNVAAVLSSAGIPFTIAEKDARANIDEFKKFGCNGTPCVVMSSGNSKERKIYEGNRGEVGIISDIMGVRNPLYYNVDISKEKPKNLQRRR